MQKMRSLIHRCHRRDQGTNCHSTK